MRSENRYMFERPGLKMDVKNDIFWSEIWPGEPSVTPYEEFPEVRLPLGLSVVCPKSQFSHNSNT